MKRIVLAAVAAVVVATATIGATAAEDRADDELNREQDRTSVGAEKDGPEASGKYTFTDVIVGS